MSLFGRSRVAETVPLDQKDVTMLGIACIAAAKIEEDERDGARYAETRGRLLNRVRSIRRSALPDEESGALQVGFEQRDLTVTRRAIRTALNIAAEPHKIIELASSITLQVVEHDGQLTGVMPGIQQYTVEDVVLGLRALDQKITGRRSGDDAAAEYSGGIIDDRGLTRG